MNDLSEAYVKSGELLLYTFVVCELWNIYTYFHVLSCILIHTKVSMLLSGSRILNRSAVFQPVLFLKKNKNNFDRTLLLNAGQTNTVFDTFNIYCLYVSHGLGFSFRYDVQM